MRQLGQIGCRYDASGLRRFSRPKRDALVACHNRPEMPDACGAPQQRRLILTTDTPLDCLVIGAGPTGLTPATYLGRFRRCYALVDGRASRAAWIPRSHNHAGFPDGITGPDLLARMAAQAREYGARIVPGTVTALSRGGDGLFTANLDGARLQARTVLLATGVVDGSPAMADLHGAVHRGLVRYCGICDAYEAIGAKVGVIGRGEGGAGEAVFLRTYTPDITLFSLGGPLQLGTEHQRLVAEAGIVPVRSAVRDVATEGDKVVVTTDDGQAHRFDHLYSAFGDTIRSDLARDLGAELADKGCIVTDPHQRTSVNGLFAAGDVTVGLDQISAAMGYAAVAATAIHNRLRGCA